jgi:hypothetical protein
MLCFIPMLICIVNMGNTFPFVNVLSESKLSRPKLIKYVFTDDAPKELPVEFLEPVMGKQEHKQAKTRNCLSLKFNSSQEKFARSTLDYHPHPVEKL